MKLTLHRFLTLTGLFDNKRNIIDAIKNKEIKLNKETITNPKYQFNPNTNSVFWKDKKIEHDKKHYYLI